MAAASRIKRWSNKGSGRIALLISLFTLGVTGYQTLITQEQADVARRQADLAQAQVAQLNNQFRLSGAFVAARNDVVLDAAPFGVKLSKGDIALNAPGTTIDTERIDHYHVFLRTFVDNTGRQPALIKDYHVEVERDKYAQAVGTPFRSSPMNCARQNARSEDCSKILPLTLNPGQTLTIETYINQWFPNIIDAGIGEDGLKYWLDVMAQTRSLSMV